MERQNVTLSLPKTLLRRAKILSAKSGKSLSELMRESLEKKTTEDTDYKKAKKRALKLMRKDIDFGTEEKIGISREELQGQYFRCNRHTFAL